VRDAVKLLAILISCLLFRTLIIYLDVILQQYFIFIRFDLSFVIRSVLIVIMTISIVHFVHKNSNSKIEVKNEQHWLLADGAVKVLIVIGFIVFLRMFAGYLLLFFYTRFIIHSFFPSITIFLDLMNQQKYLIKS
jgi:hypothetical protein